MLQEAQPLLARQPNRPHYIREWARMKKMKQVDLARALGADKSLVSRWYRGTSPGPEWQEQLATLFGCEPEGIFRHPDEEWLSSFLRGRDPEEISRIKATLEAAFPRHL
jgi:transcriptional regulator with XRE-family HTH domain